MNATTARTAFTQESGDRVRLHIDAGIARITLNRPRRLNAFDHAMAAEWVAATVEATSRADVRAIIVSGAGRGFCAGGDVLAMNEPATGKDLQDLAEQINVGIIALWGSRVPVVAAAAGTTAGGGLGILLACDYAVAGADSKIGALYGNIGLTPDLSVSALLGRAIGERRTLQLTLTDRMLSADEALEWGLVAEVTEPELVVARAEAIARTWADGAFTALGDAKRLIRSEPGTTFAAQLQEEARTIGRARDTEQAADRIRAFATRIPREAPPMQPRTEGDEIT